MAKFSFADIVLRSLALKQQAEQAAMQADLEREKIDVSRQGVKVEERRAKTEEDKLGFERDKLKFEREKFREMKGLYKAQAEELELKNKFLNLTIPKGEVEKTLKSFNAPGLDLSFFEVPGDSNRVYFTPVLQLLSALVPYAERDTRLKELAERYAAQDLTRQQMELFLDQVKASGELLQTALTGAKFDEAQLEQLYKKYESGAENTVKLKTVIPPSTKEPPPGSAYYGAGQRFYPIEFTKSYPSGIPNYVKYVLGIATDAQNFADTLKKKTALTDKNKLSASPIIGPLAGEMASEYKSGLENIIRLIEEDEYDLKKWIDEKTLHWMRNLKDVMERISVVHNVMETGVGPFGAKEGIKAMLRKETQK